MPAVQPPRRSPRSIARLFDKTRRDVLVTQTREARLRLGLRLLGLTGAGTSRVLNSSNAVVRRVLGNLASEDYVRFEPLTSSALRYAQRTAAMKLTRIPYDVSEGAALKFGYGERERLRVEPATDGFAVAWTTRLPSELLLERLRIFVPDEGDAELFINADGSFRAATVPSGQAIDTLIGSETPPFWRLELPERALTWQRELDGRPRQPPVGLMGYISDQREPAYLTELLTATATPFIGLSARSIVAECEPTIELALASQPSEESHEL